MKTRLVILGFYEYAENWKRDFTIGVMNVTLNHIDG